MFAGLASIALPGLSGFVPEYLVLIGTYKVNVVLAIFAVFGVILAAMYILLPYQKMFTGRVKPEQAHMKDLNSRERLVVAPLVLGMAVLGIWSAPLVGSMNQISEHLAPNIAFAGEAEGELTGAPATGFALDTVTLDLNEGNAQ